MASFLSRATPESNGVSSAAIAAFVDAVNEELGGLHSLMIVRHGDVIAEGWWQPYAPARPHQLYSLSKSFTSTAAGLAIAEGRLSLDDTVVSFFPDDLPETVSENLAAMRVRHLLSMSTGHGEDTLGALWRGNLNNWVQAFLAAPVTHEPGTHFVYNSGATYMVSAILAKVTGERLLDYLQPRLFEPLQIANPAWDQCPRGIDVGGWGLNITTEDIAKFGLLYVQDGVWEGKRLLPEGWVADATRRHSDNGSDPESDWSQGYGFQFWRCRHNAYRGDGAFGQYCVVMPDQDTVVAITSGVGNMQMVLNLLWEHLLPALQPDPLAEDAAAQSALTEKLTNLAVPTPRGDAIVPLAATVTGRTYNFPENALEISRIQVVFAENQGTLTIEDSKGTHVLTFGLGAWLAGDSAFQQPVSRPILAYGAWTAPDTLEVRLCYVETPFCPILRCRFEGERLFFDLQGILGFGSAERPTIEGAV